MTEDDERIDSQYWLPHNHPVVTPERLAKGDLVAVETDRGGKEVRTILWPPDCYIANRLITPRQYFAAQRLYRLWAGSKHQHHHVQVSYEERNTRTGPIYLHGVVVESRFLMSLEYCESMTAIRGEAERRVVYSVCCYGEFAKNLVARSRRAAQRTGMELLRSGLDDLADFYHQQKLLAQ